MVPLVPISTGVFSAMFEELLQERRCIYREELKEVTCRWTEWLGFCIGDGIALSLGRSGFGSVPNFSLYFT